MRSNQLVFVLVGVLFISTLFTTMLVYKYRTASDQAREFQPKMMQNITILQQYTQSMVTEAVEYSKKDPSIDPVLQKLGLVTPKAGGVTLPPANTPKPSGR